MRAAPLLLAAIVLAGCNSQPAEPTLAENEAMQRNAAAALKGWDRVFGFPAETVGRLNQFGFRLGAYEAANGGHAAKGSRVTLSQSDATSPNTGTVELTGANAEAVDRVVFTLALTDPENAATARKRFVDIVRGFLFNYDLNDGGALDPVVAGKPGPTPAADAPIAVTTDQVDGASRVLVTLRRSDAPAPPEPAAQNNTQP